MSDQTQQRVFSWHAGEGHIFEVVREPKSNNVSRDGYEWVAAGTIAKFKGDVAIDLLNFSIAALKHKGWAWVEPS